MRLLRRNHIPSTLYQVKWYNRSPTFRDSHLTRLPKCITVWSPVDSVCTMVCSAAMFDKVSKFFWEKIFQNFCYRLPNNTKRVAHIRHNISKYSSYAINKKYLLSFPCKIICLRGIDPITQPFIAHNKLVEKKNGLRYINIIQLLWTPLERVSECHIVIEPVNIFMGSTSSHFVAPLASEWATNATTFTAEPTQATVVSPHMQSFSSQPNPMNPSLWLAVVPVLLYNRLIGQHHLQAIVPGISFSGGSGGPTKHRALTNVTARKCPLARVTAGNYCAWVESIHVQDKFPGSFKKGGNFIHLVLSNGLIT